LRAFLVPTSKQNFNMLNKPKITQTSRSVLTIRFDEIATGWEYWVLLLSDNHHDSRYCRRDLEKKHLDMVKERDGLAIFFGDTFDAMQGKFDPRRSLEDVRPEDSSADYFNKIVEHAVEDYLPYASNIALFAKGNHETAVLDKTNTDLISNLVYRMNSENSNKDHRIFAGHYGGWVRFMFNAHKTKRNSLRLKYNHGNGGVAPVTRGVIQTNRQAVFLPDADIVVNGHNHQGWVLPIARERLTNAGKVQKDLCWFVWVPGYHDGYGDGSSGYAVQKNTGPTPHGSVWLKFYFEGRSVKVQPIPEFE
jgi:predicted phosphodiesterase